MEILTSKNHLEFLAFLPKIKPSIVEWQLVTVKLLDMPAEKLSSTQAADVLKSLFKDKEGLIYLGGERELLMLLHEGIISSPPGALSKKIESALPAGYCDVHIEKPTAENLSRLTISIKITPPKILSASSAQRQARTENIVLIADDDMYMRTLLKKGFNEKFTVHEVIHGSEIVSAYKKYNPDILFLDIHMPGKDGMENLASLLALDPDAYIVMLSSDSSIENVTKTVKNGAKGFMAKPFSKDKLLEYVEKCPTIF